MHLPTDYDHAPNEHIDTALTAASFGLREVHKALASGSLQADHIQWVIETRNYMAYMLARFTDGPERGMAWPSDVAAMRGYEADAERVLQTVEHAA